MHKQVTGRINDRLKVYTDDPFLLSSLETLKAKKPQSFNPKKVLTEFCSQIDQYIENLGISDIITDLANDEED